MNLELKILPMKLRFISEFCQTFKEEIPTSFESLCPAQMYALKCQNPALFRDEVIRMGPGALALACLSKEEAWRQTDVGQAPPHEPRGEAWSRSPWLSVGALLSDAKLPVSFFCFRNPVCGEL